MNNIIFSISVVYKYSVCVHTYVRETECRKMYIKIEKKNILTRRKTTEKLMRNAGSLMLQNGSTGSVKPVTELTLYFAFLDSISEDCSLARYCGLGGSDSGVKSVKPHL